MARIYTRAGDGGETGLLDGRRVAKSHPRIAASGDVDELNAALGLARALLGPAAGDLDDELAGVQVDLFALGALISDPRAAEGLPRGDHRLDLGPERVSQLEALVDRWQATLEPLRAFIVPAGAPAAGALHVARAVARRAERSVAALDEGPADEGRRLALVYLNRLADVLFVAARVANRAAGVDDVTWTP